MLHHNYNAAFKESQGRDRNSKNFYGPTLETPQRSQKGDWVIKKCVLVWRKKIRKIEGTESKLWHSRICLDGAKKWKRSLRLLAVLPAAPVISRRKNPPLAALPAVLATSRRKNPLLAALPAAPATSRRKSPPLAALPAVLATNNPSYPRESCSRQGHPVGNL